MFSKEEDNGAGEINHITMKAVWLGIMQTLSGYTT